MLVVYKRNPTTSHDDDDAILQYTILRIGDAQHFPRGSNIWADDTQVDNPSGGRPSTRWIDRRIGDHHVMLVDLQCEGGNLVELAWDLVGFAVARLVT